MKSRLIAMATAVALFATPFISEPVYAGTVTGKIKNLFVRASDGLIWVIVDGTGAGRPTCAANQSYFMIKSETSDTGKNQYSLLLSAYLTGTSVTISGANTCTRWPDGEDIDTIVLGS